VDNSPFQEKKTPQKAKGNFSKKRCLKMNRFAMTIYLGALPPNPHLGTSPLSTPSSPEGRWASTLRFDTHCWTG